MRQRTEILLLCLILLLGFGLRVGWPALTEFKYDEALLLARALDVAEGTTFHVRGISSSVGLPNFPLNVWVYALPLLFWRHVYAATLFTGLVNGLAVAGAWWWTRRYWGPHAALAAALLFAVSPWSVFHARKIWAQNLLTPLVLGWAIGASLALAEQRRRAILLHLFCLAAAVQVHLAAMALLPASALLLIVHRRRVAWRWVGLSVLLGALPAVPFFLHLWRTDALAAVGRAAGAGGGSLSLASWRFAWLLLTGREIHALAGPDAFTSYLATVPDLTAVHLLWAGLSLAGLIILARAWWRGRKEEGPLPVVAFILLLWCLVPPLFYMWPIAPVVLHYLLPFYPAPYIAGGIAVAWLAAARPRWRWPLWGAIGAGAGLQVYVWLALLFFLARTETPGGFGTPLGRHLTAVDRAEATLAAQNLPEILVAGGGERADEEELAAVYDTLLRDRPHRLVNVTQSALFPAGGAVVILAQPDGQASFYRAQATQIDRVPRRQGAAPIEILTLADDAPQPGVPLLVPATFANGVEILGYDPVASGDEGRRWRLYWQPGPAQPSSAYNFFNHLLDEEAGRLTQADGPTFSPAQWRPGDRVVSLFWLAPVTAEPAAMRVGLYGYPDLVTVPLVDEAGNPAGDWVDLPFVPPS